MLKRFDNILVVCGVVLVIGAVGYIIFSNLFLKPKTKTLTDPVITPSASPAPLEMTDQKAENILKNSLVLVPDSDLKVQLFDGAGKSEGTESAQVNFISTAGMTETGKENFDLYGSYAVNFGGSGSFVYVGLVNATQAGNEFTSTTPYLGDRIIVKSATASAVLTADYDLTVAFLVRKETDSMADTPSVATFSAYPVRNHIITY